MLVLNIAVNDFCRKIAFLVQLQPGARSNRICHTQCMQDDGKETYRRHRMQMSKASSSSSTIPPQIPRIIPTSSISAASTPTSIKTYTRFSAAGVALYSQDHPTSFKQFLSGDTTLKSSERVKWTGLNFQKYWIKCIFFFGGIAFFHLWFTQGMPIHK